MCLHKQIGLLFTQSDAQTELGARLKNKKVNVWA